MAIWLLPFLGCEAPPSRNHFPQIQAVHLASDHLEQGERTQVECRATDPDGDPLSYEWSTSNGLIEGDGYSIDYVAPAVVGGQRITCRVRDTAGAEAVESGYVFVNARQVPPEEFLLDVSAEQQVLRLRDVGSAQLPLEEGTYAVSLLETQQAMRSAGNPFETLFVISTPDQPRVLLPGQTIQLYVAAKNGLYAFYVEGGVITDNSGSFVLETTAGSSGITDQWTISAREHTLTPDAGEMAEIVLEAGDYLIWAYENEAFSGATQRFRDLILIPGHGEGMLLDLGSIEALELGNTVHVSAFFADPFKVGDDHGLCRIVFER